MKLRQGIARRPPRFPRQSVRRCAPVLLAAMALLGNLLARAADSATITFSLDFPTSDPEHYSISVQSDGSASYECSAKISSESEDYETYQTRFDFSDATRSKIFGLAAQARYFSGKIDSGNRKLAQTGVKKLSYKDGQRQFAAEYNFSMQPPVQQLTILFQNVSATLEFGRRLGHYHRYQKLALDDELKRMEEQARTGNLVELQAVKPVLQEIYDDSTVINVVRARARRIMDMAAGPPAKR